MEHEKQYSTADSCSQATKIKTNFARIIVGGKAEKPCYDILYFDPADGKYHIGFGSYYLEYVFKWLSEEFEIADVPAADIVPVVRCRDCEIHGHCDAEDVFSFAGISNPFCCAGKRKEGDRNE